MKDNDRCAVVSLNDNDYINKELTSDKEKINKQIDELRGGSSYSRGGIDNGLKLFELYPAPNRQKYIILLTDGEDGNDINAVVSAQKAGKQGVKIYAVGFGNTADHEHLEI